MKLIPKYQQGNPFLLTFKPIGSASRSQSQSGASDYYTAQVKEQELRMKAKDKARENAGTTVKDLLELTGKIDGLNSDIQATSAYIKTALTNYQLMGDDDVNQLNNIYMNVTQQLGQLKANKEFYNQTIDNVKEQKSMTDIAVSDNNEMWSINGTTITRVGINEYLSDPYKYHLMTVGQVLDLRANNPQYANSNSILSIANNTIGIEKVNQMVKSLIPSIGYSQSDIIQSEKQQQIQQGLNALEEAQDQAEQNNTTVTEMLKTEKMDKQNKDQLLSVLNYVWNSLPEGAKVTLALHSTKGQYSNASDAAMNTLIQLMTGKQIEEHKQVQEHTITYGGLKSSSGNSSNSTNSDSGSTTDMKMKVTPAYNYYRGNGEHEQLQLIPGTQKAFNVNVTKANPDCKAGNATAGTVFADILQHSFGKVFDTRNMSIGGVPVQSDAVQQIVMTSGTIYQAELPITTNQGVIVPDFSMLDKKKSVDNNLNAWLKSKGVKGTIETQAVLNQYNKTINAYYKKNNIPIQYVKTNTGWVQRFLCKTRRFNIVPAYVPEKYVLGSVDRAFGENIDAPDSVNAAIKAYNKNDEGLKAGWFNWSANNVYKTSLFILMTNDAIGLNQQDNKLTEAQSQDIMQNQERRQIANDTFVDLQPE